MRWDQPDGLWMPLALLVLANATCTFAAADEKGKIVLAEDGRSAYRIVIAERPSPSTRYAAEELQGFLEKMTGARLSIVAETVPAVPNEILVGPSSRLKTLGIDLGTAALGREGYLLRTVGPRLVVAGGEPRGTLYGVYGLLEDHFGCRWFTPELERIPRSNRLVLPPLDERRVPVFEYRETYTWESYDANWMARNRLNGAGGRGRLEDADVAEQLDAAVAGVDPADVVSLLDALDDPGELDYDPEARRRFAALAAEIRLLRRGDQVDHLIDKRLEAGIGVGGEGVGRRLDPLGHV